MNDCPRCALGDHGTARRPDGVKHRATVPRPDLEELSAWLDDASCEATDGCDGIEPDGRCPHGHSAWPLALGLI